MAKVSAHGEIIGTLEYLTHAKRFMSDGVVLVNQGFGWKLRGKIKPELTPQQAFENAKSRLDARLRDRPAVAVYRAELHAMAGVGKRWKLHAAVQMMPDDADGVWSEACDGYGDNVCASVDEVAVLCRAYKVAMMEQGDINKEMNAA